MLLSQSKFKEAVQLYIDFLEDPDFVSNKGNTDYSIWMALCETISKNPDCIQNAEKVI